jgi:hypothetical protein
MADADAYASVLADGKLKLKLPKKKHKKHKRDKKRKKTKQAPR